MQYRVKNPITVSTSWDNVNNIANTVLNQLYPRVGEVFEGKAVIDMNGYKSICGSKNVLGVSYQFCFAPNNVEPIIFGIPINAITLIIAGLVGFLIFKVTREK